MQHYHLTDQAGTFRGTKALTDAMADRLEAKGWHVVPTESPVQVRRFLTRTAS